MDITVKREIMGKPLVTIMVPCYNMEHKIERLLDSILNQSYQKLHVVVIDDGSVDRSKDVVLNFSKKFKDKGIEFEYVHKENGGLGSAINTGLKYIKGVFFCWPDADDWLSDDSIEKRVAFLEDHPDYALVRSDAAVYYEGNLTKPSGCITHKKPHRFKETNLFEDYILEKNVIFCPGCHMVRTSAFKKINPEMDIFEGKMGQNYQMLMPLIYLYKFGYIDECLYNYVIYNNSMSHRKGAAFERINNQEEILLETLDRIEMSSQERDYFKQLTKQKYVIWRCLAALTDGTKKDFKTAYQSYDKKFLYYFRITTIARFWIARACYFIPGAFMITKFLSKRR